MSGARYRLYFKAAAGAEAWSGYTYDDYAEAETAAAHYRADLTDTTVTVVIDDGERPRTPAAQVTPLPGR